MGTDFFGVQIILIRLNKIKMLNFTLNQTQENTKNQNLFYRNVQYLYFELLYHNTVFTLFLYKI